MRGGWRAGGTAGFPGVRQARARLRGPPGKPQGWKDVTPAAAVLPALTDAERAAGYVLFSRNPMGAPQVCDVPFRFEIDRPIITFAALGEYEPILLCVRPLEDLEDAALTVSDLVGPGGKLLGTQNIDVRQLWIQRRAEDRAAKTYHLVPEILEAAHPTAMAKGLTRQYWLTLFAPKDAVPGVYRGTATFRAKGRPSATREIALRVLPFELDPPGLSYGVFYALYRDWLKAFGEGEVIPGQRMKHLVDQREHGMNCLTVSSPMKLALRGSGEDIEPVFDASQPGEGDLATFTSLDEELNSAREAGFDRTRCVWFGDSDFTELSKELLQLWNHQDPKLFDADRVRPGTGLFDRIYDAALSAGVGRFREAQLPEPYVCVLGRPSDTEELARACERYLAVARKLDDLTFLFVNGGPHGADQSGRFKGKLDVACHSDAYRIARPRRRQASRREAGLDLRRGQLHGRSFQPHAVRLVPVAHRRGGRAGMGVSVARTRRHVRRLVRRRVERDGRVSSGKRHGGAVQRARRAWIVRLSEPGRPAADGGMGRLSRGGGRRALRTDARTALPREAGGEAGRRGGGPAGTGGHDRAVLHQ